MSGKAPRRYKQIDELTPDEHLARKQAGHRGEELRFETEKYRAFRAEVLRDAGLEVDEKDARAAAEEYGGDWRDELDQKADEQKELEQMSPAAHAKRQGR